MIVRVQQRLLTQASATSDRHIRSQKAARCSLRDKIFTPHLADSRPLPLGWLWSGVDAISFALQAVAAVLPGPAGAWFGLPAYSVMPAPDWPYRVFRAAIVRLSALALEAQGRLAIRQELDAGEGTILRQNSAGGLWLAQAAPIRLGCCCSSLAGSCR